MRLLLVIGLVLLTGCAVRIASTPFPGASAQLHIPQCQDGFGSVQLWSIASRLTGESTEFRTNEPAPKTLFLRPGSYELQVACKRDSKGCGYLHGNVLHLDAAPSYQLSAKAGDRITVDCDAHSDKVTFSYDGA